MLNRVNKNQHDISKLPTGRICRLGDDRCPVGGTNGLDMQAMAC